MRWFLPALVLIALFFYLLMDSKALEFKERTQGRTDLVERVAMTPVFHGDRLVENIERRLSVARQWIDDKIRQASK